MIDRRSVLLAGISALPAFVAGRRPAFASLTRTLDGRVQLPDGRCLGYADYGDASGPLVLYFHGTPGSRLEGKLIADEAATAGIRLVAVGRPGMGLSDYQSNRRILDWPADVACLVQALGYGDSAFGILGLSGGAPYALACVRAMPSRITHAAICSGHTPMNAPGVARGNQDRVIEFVNRRPRIASAFIGGMIRQLDRHPNRITERIGENWSAADRRLILDDPVLRAELVLTLKEAARHGPQGIVTDVGLLARPWGFRLDDLPPASISIWQGACDPIAPPSMGHYFHQHLVGSELTIDTTAGHLTMLKWHAAEIMQRFV